MLILFKGFKIFKVRMQGGLGNQMFIYAFAKMLEQRGYPTCLDGRLYNYSKCSRKNQSLDHISIRKLEILNFNLSLPFVRCSKSKALLCHKATIQQKIFGKIGKYLSDLAEQNRLISEANFSLEKLNSIPSNACFEGYFQNVKYFQDIRHLLLEDFSINKPLSLKNQEIKSKIQEAQNSCFIHIRRGDYLDPKHWMFVKLGKTYYKQAISILQEFYEKINFFVFSNDIQWCKENLQKLLGGGDIHSLLLKTMEKAMQSKKWN